MSLALSTDGTVTIGGAGPDDRRSASPGRWRLDGRQLTIDGSSWIAGEFDIMRLDEEELVLRRK